ncbi:uncharacterized mitochondrial protein AtMg00810-like [Rhodamnia argentea]|uniref:Uncharacterized mitochondrial protein AtMg00810-like n=1 Tax=Rhodamnia argentea TaxID=178133 RepID=A0ABM3H4E6_9MYRT|nr:uncharacterized mitochondrial protein AtMg00810-like [Rhodamnia argentea]
MRFFTENLMRRFTCTFHQVLQMALLLESEIVRLKNALGKEFEIKDLGKLRYFLGIEVSRSSHGIFLCRRKYILDLLSRIGMLGCKSIDTPLDSNAKIWAKTGELVDRESYQRLVGKLIYLSHTRPDIAYTIGFVSQFMHDPYTTHMDVVTRILRYLKGTPGKGILFGNHGHLKAETFADADWAGDVDDS